MRWRAEEERQARNKRGQTLFRPRFFEAFCPAVAQRYNSCRVTLVDMRERKGGGSKETSMTPPTIHTRTPFALLKPPIFLCCDPVEPPFASIRPLSQPFLSGQLYEALPAASVTFLLWGSKVKSRLNTQPLEKNTKYIQEQPSNPPPALYSLE